MVERLTNKIEILNLIKKIYFDILYFRLTFRSLNPSKVLSLPMGGVHRSFHREADFLGIFTDTAYSPFSFTEISTVGKNPPTYCWHID